MSLIPSESYSFPDHFTRTVTYSNTPKKKAAPAEPEPVAKKSFFFRARNSAPKREKKPPRLTALPDPVVENFFEESVSPPSPEPDFIPEETVPPSAQEFLSVLPDPIPSVTEDSKPNGEFEQAPPPDVDVPISPRPVRPEPLIKKCAVPRNLKPKPRWNSRGVPFVPVAAQQPPAANEIEAPIAPIVERAPEPAVVSMKPTVVPAEPIAPIPPPLTAEAPPAHAQVVNAPTPDLMQILFAHAAKAAPQVQPEPPKPTPAARPRPARREIPTMVPRPAPVVPTTVNREFDFNAPAEEMNEPATKSRRSSKLRRFVFCESIVIGALIPLAILGFSRVFTNSAVVLLLDLLTIAAAVTSAVIPILFFAVAPTLPRDESGNRL
jgi:hypothetical protein